jgi:hypothetical protein
MIRHCSLLLRHSALKVDYHRNIHFFLWGKHCLVIFDSLVNVSSRLVVSNQHKAIVRIRETALINDHQITI